MSKRNLFDEMMQGIDEMAAQREDKVTPPVDSHDGWFRAKVQEVMNSTQPSLTHPDRQTMYCVGFNFLSPRAFLNRNAFSCVAA